MSSTSGIKDNLSVLQTVRLLQFVHVADKENIEKLLKHGVDNLINLTAPEDGITALHLAVSLINEELVQFLLSHGASPNIQDRRGRTVVMLAAEMGFDTLVDLFIQHKADLRLQDAEGKGVLFYCSYPTKAHIRCLESALSFHADPNNVSAKGTHVFQLMCNRMVDYPHMCLIMLDSGADPNASNPKTGFTVLMEAAKAGSVELTRAILQKGGNPNAVDKKLLTAVHYAAMGGFFEVIQVLSAYSANMDIVSVEEYTALHYAAASGNANCCRFIAQRGCNPKLKNQEGLLPDKIAKDSGHTEASKVLRKAKKQHGKGKKPSKTGLMSNLWALTLHDWSNEYQTELCQAFGEDSDTITTEMFISVLERLKAPVNMEQLRLVVKVHDKENKGCVNINNFFNGVKYIKKPFRLATYLPKQKKKKKAKKGKKKKKGKCPLPVCILSQDRMARRAEGGWPYVMIKKYRYCLDSDRFDGDHEQGHPMIDDHVKPENEYVHINYCVRNEDFDSLDLAFRQGVPVDVQDELYKTPLMVACSSGIYDMVKYLLSKGASVKMRDQFFWTPLHHAASSGHVKIVKLLVRAGATIDEKSLSRVTPLMMAIELSHPSCVEYLIKAGANVNAKNKNEQNCLDIAKAFLDLRVIDLVETKMRSLPQLPKEAEEKKGKAQKSKTRK